jgi:hypothetical protein
MLQMIRWWSEHLGGGATPHYLSLKYHMSWCCETCVMCVNHVTIGALVGVWGFCSIVHSRLCGQVMCNVCKTCDNCEFAALDGASVVMLKLWIWVWVRVVLLSRHWHWNYPILPVHGSLGAGIIVTQIIACRYRLPVSGSLSVPRAGALEVVVAL